MRSTPLAREARYVTLTIDDLSGLEAISVEPPHTAMREEKRRIIKDKLGELVTSTCISCRATSFSRTPATAYIVSLIDSCSRLAWAEVLPRRRRSRSCSRR